MSDSEMRFKIVKDPIQWLSLSWSGLHKGQQPWTWRQNVLQWPRRQRTEWKPRQKQLLPPSVCLRTVQGVYSQTLQSTAGLCNAQLSASPTARFPFQDPVWNTACSCSAAASAALSPQAKNIWWSTWRITRETSSASSWTKSSSSRLELRQQGSSQQSETSDLLQICISRLSLPTHFIMTLYLKVMSFKGV